MEEKKSIFYAQCKRVENEAQAKAFLDQVKDQYPDANHHVYAWYIGGRDGHMLQRFSDDGEPHGTSGPPVLDVLAKANILDAAIVVTRYFGGTLLGTGGLVKAYGSAASGAVRQAGLVDRIPAFYYHISFPYSFVDQLTHRLEQAQIEIREKTFLAQVHYDLVVPAESVPAVLDLIQEISQGQALVEKGDLTFFDRALGKGEGAGYE